MAIRRLVPSDAAAFQSLRLQSLEDASSAFGSSYGEEASMPLSAIEDRLAVLPDRGIFGAFEEGRLVGIAGLGRESLRKLSHKAFIWGMYVAPAHRRTGLATALLAEAVAFARGIADVRQVNLCVNASASAAIHLYQMFGFVTFGLEPEAMLINGALYDELHMRLARSPG
jgi:RimJ/RimL family protein N-acetyltransferase